MLSVLSTRNATSTWDEKERTGGLAALGKYMDCGDSVPLCGTLTLETGLGPGAYRHGNVSVHGLWPEYDGTHANFGWPKSVVAYSPIRWPPGFINQSVFRGYCSSPRHQKHRKSLHFVDFADQEYEKSLRFLVFSIH